MDAARVAALRELLASTGWVERTHTFARTMRRSTRTPGGLLLVGTPDEEPWHLAAHLDDESRWTGVVEIRPTLVRWSVPEGAPPHLAVTLSGSSRRPAARRCSWSPSRRRPDGCSSGPGTPAGTARPSCRWTAATSSWPASPTSRCPVAPGRPRRAGAVVRLRPAPGQRRHRRGRPPAATCEPAPQGPAHPARRTSWTPSAARPRAPDAPMRPPTVPARARAERRHDASPWAHA